MGTLLLSSGPWRLELSENGHVCSLRDAITELVSTASASTLCEVASGATGQHAVLSSARLLRHTDSMAEFEGVLDLGTPVRVRFAFSVSEPDEQGTAVLCTVALLPETPLSTDVHMRWFWNVRHPSREASVFSPLFDGRGQVTSRRTNQAWNYVCAGGGGEGERLAIPLVDEGLPGDLHLAFLADPFFSTGITVPADESSATFECRFLAGAGARQFPARMFGLYLHHGDADTALQAFFRHAIVRCPPGPAWLHEIALVHYDFLSEQGEGWFRDIDRLVELVAPEDRRRIVLTLHGWYDLLGRYCFNAATQTLDARWTVMPGGEKKEMTLGEIHRRIAYAKERGFRMLLYYADGLAIDSGAPTYDEEIVFREPDGSLRKHHWSGPDTITQTFVMNPVHPRVQAFFRGYTRALLNEFGNEIDGLTWDETFTIRAGDLSRAPHEGYADREFMLLAKELRDTVKARNPEIAFLASDCTGLSLPQDDGSTWRATPAQNAVVFDGTYQDSQCYPTAWQYGLFPNYRNVLWSCNWRPVEHFEWTVLGVQAFGVPVAISNGWGEDKGIARYSQSETEQLLRLFALRKGQRSRVRWIESREA